MEGKEIGVLCMLSKITHKFRKGDFMKYDRKNPDNFTLILNFAFAFLVDTIELLASWCQKMGPTPSETEVYSSLWMWKEASKT